MKVACDAHSLPQRTQTPLAVDPRNDQVVYVGLEQDGFSKTTDGGATWRRVISGLGGRERIAGGSPCFSEFYSTVVDLRDSNHVCTALAASPGTVATLQSSKEGVYCSEDGGETWKQKVSPTMNTAICAVAIDPRDSRVLYAGANGNPSSFKEADPNKLYNSVGAVYKSSDGGQTWAELETHYVKGMRVSDVMVAESDSNLLYASAFVLAPNGAAGGSGPDGTQFGAIKSVDGGATWEVRNTGMDTAQPGYMAITRLALSPRDARRLFATAMSARMYYSADGGESFARAQSRAYMTAVAFDPGDPQGDRLVGAEQAGLQVLASEDGGANWAVLADLPESARADGAQVTDLAFSRQDSRVLYISGSHGRVHKSIDGGMTWTRILSGDSLPR